MRRLAFVVGLGLSIAGCGSDSSGAGSGGQSAGGTGGTSGAAGAGGVAGAAGTGSCTADTGTDPENCGACGKSCFGGACVDGSCTPVALSTTGTPTAIAANGASVFWGDADGIVSRVDLPHGTPQKLATSPGPVTRLTLDATNAYWTSPNMISAYQVPLDGGALVTLFDSGMNSPWGIAVSATDVYVSQNGWPGSIHRVPIGGGALSVFTAASWVSQLLIDGDTMYWISYDYSEPEMSAVTHRPLGNGVAQNLATNIGYVVGLALDATHAYWVDGAGGTVSRIPRNGGSVTTLASGLQSPQGIAVDDGFIFVTQWGSGGGAVGSVYRIPKDGGELTAIAVDEHHPTDICATQSGVFWVNQGSQGVDGSVKAFGK